MSAATCPYCGFVNKTAYDVKTTEKGRAGGWEHHYTATCSECGKRFTIVEHK